MIKHIKENRISIFAWITGEYLNQNKTIDNIAIAIERDNMKLFLSLYSLLFNGAGRILEYELKKEDEIINKDISHGQNFFFEQLTIQRSQNANSLIEINKSAKSVVISLAESDFIKLFVKFYAGFQISAIGSEHKMKFQFLDTDTMKATEGELIIWRLINGTLIDLSHGVKK